MAGFFRAPNYFRDSDNSVLDCVDNGVIEY